ncbi:MAG: prefoldin subunit alpha [Nanoarchaeota archaeon]|nr:prefoldin subunit alpha [Nanoarchaeota archaeon]
MVDEKKVQEKYMEYQMVEQQLKQLQQQIQAIDSKLEEAAVLFNSLEEIKAAKPGSEVLVPMSNGIFVKGTLTDASTMLVNVGGGVVVDKTVQEVKDLIKTQIDEIQKAREQAVIEFEKVLKSYSDIEEQLKKMVE